MSSRPSRSPHHRSRHRRALHLGALYVAAHAAWLYVSNAVGAVAHARWIGESWIALPFAVAALLAARRWAAPAAAPLRRARGWLVASCALQVVASLLFAAARETDLKAALGVARLLALASLALLAIAIARLPLARTAPAPAAARRLDLATAGVGSGLVLWHTVLGAAVTTAHGDLLRIVLPSIAPALDLVMLIMLGARLQSLGGRDRAVLWWLAASRGASLAAQLAVGMVVRAGAWRPGTWVEALWVVSGVTLALALWRGRSGAASPTDDHPRAAEPPDAADPGADLVERLLPLAGVAMAVGPLLASTRALWRGPAGVTVFGSVVVMGLILARQRVALGAQRRAEAALRAQHEALRRQAEEIEAQHDTLLAQQEELELLSAIARQTDDAVLTTDRTARITWANAAWEQLSGYTLEEVRGRTPDVPRVGPETDVDVVRSLHDVVGRGEGCAVDVLYYRKDGTPYWVAITTTPIRDARGDVTAFVGIERDVTARKSQEAALHALAMRDELTALHNRRGFLQLAGERLEAALAARTPQVLLYADLDGFKRINDTLGHEVGDAALVEVSAVLHAVFGETAVLARIGGDEFTVLAPATGPGDVPAILTALEAAIAARNAQGGRAYHLAMSIGAACFDVDRPVPIDELLRAADAELYAAKETRRVRRAVVE